MSEKENNNSIVNFDSGEKACFNNNGISFLEISSINDNKVFFCKDLSVIDNILLIWSSSVNIVANDVP